jgi:hypothetical protein
MTPRTQAGFTITELSISVVVAGFMAAVIFAATFFYYTNVQQAEVSASLGLDSQSILTQLTDDTRLADAISTTNAITDSHAPVGGWVTSDPSNVIIIESPAVDSSHNIIFDTSTGLPYRNEFIYFTTGTSMYKRVLANTAATGNTAVTTCPAGAVSSSCPADRVFSNNVKDLNFTFYDAPNNTTADATQARSVLLTVNMNKKVFGKNVELDNSTRVTLRNQ